MKKLLILPLLVLLTGCVTYYYPETAFEDGVYYAEDDPSYVLNQGRYIGVAYYPWASLDYFYFGYQPYPIYPYYYGFPAGFAAGYSPWHYPFGGYGFYSPLYVSYYHYPFYPVWRPYGGYCSHHGGCGRGHDQQRNPGRQRFAGNPKSVPRKGENSETGDEEYPFENLNSLKSAGGGNGLSYHAYRSYMPSGYTGNSGMVVRNNEATKKIGKSLVQPVRSGSTANNIIVTGAPPGSGVVNPAQVSRGAPADVAANRSSYRPPSRATVTAAPRTSPGASNRSRSRHSSPPMRSSKSGSSHPRSKRDQP